MTAEPRTIESEDESITGAVGPPWAHDPRVFEWDAYVGPDSAPVRFQFREFGCVLEVAGECVTIRDARSPFESAPPHEEGLLESVDVSSYQDRDLTFLLDNLAPRPTHVIVRLYQDFCEGPSSAHSIAQIESALENHCSVAGYVWIYRDIDGGQSVNAALDVAQSIGVDIPILWLDCETYEGTVPTISNLHAAVGAGQARGMQMGIYTSRSQWTEWFGNSPDFAHLPLWDANYPGYKPDNLDITPYGGWTSPAAARQWTSDPCDRNLVDAAVLYPP